jgi:glutamine amidotransferase PdxT
MYRPLPHAKSLYYMNLDLYRYFIGREDQSVNEKMVIKRIDQQMHVTSLMVKAHKLDDVKNKAKSSTDICCTIWQ